MLVDDTVASDFAKWIGSSRATSEVLVRSADRDVSHLEMGRLEVLQELTHWAVRLGLVEAPSERAPVKKG